GGPTNTGLFPRRLPRISTAASTSRARPTRGSKRRCAAASERLRPRAERLGKARGSKGGIQTSGSFASPSGASGGGGGRKREKVFSIGSSRAGRGGLGSTRFVAAAFVSLRALGRGSTIAGSRGSSFCRYCRGIRPEVYQERIVFRRDERGTAQETRRA